MAGHGGAAGIAVCVSVGLAGCYLVHRPQEDVVERPRNEVLSECEQRFDTIEDSHLPLDLLFVVDNSTSMHEEQEALALQFPRLVEALTTGDRNGDGQVDFPPVADLHLGVVSSDMGAGLAGIRGCSEVGDDGILLHRPLGSDADCRGSYPSFLSYVAGRDEPQALARDFACVALLGTEGCGYEQQLEAALKALWPGQDIVVGDGKTIDADRVSFLADPNGRGRRGHGSDENAGFLRHEAPSVIAVVVISDEEDCSSRDTTHFTPAQLLEPSSPLASQGLNLRCFLNPDNLYPLERYVNALRALRPGAPHLVTFAAIVGVPPDLVSAVARAEVDFGDPTARDAYYRRILADTRMVERVEDDAADDAAAKLLPSCETPTGKAYPPRRFVELARAFGEAGVVQSICQEDFRPAIDAIVDKLGETLQVASCLSNAPDASAR